MTIHAETVNFMVFVFLGFAYCSIFDFFRALRKLKRYSNKTVNIQDIIFFLIVGMLLLFVIFTFLKEQFRLHLLLSVPLGICIYIGLVGNIFLNMYVILIQKSASFIKFVFCPLEIWMKIFNLFVEKCCKKFKYMINSNWMKFYAKKQRRVTWQEKEPKQVQIRKRKRKK